MAGDKKGANKRKNAAAAKAQKNAAVQHGAGKADPPAHPLPSPPSNIPNAPRPAVVLEPLPEEYRGDALLIFRHDMKDEPLRINGQFNPRQPDWLIVTANKVCKASRTLQKVVIEGHRTSDAEVFYNPHRRDGLPVMQHLTDLAVNMDRARKDRDFGRLDPNSLEWFDDIQAMNERDFWWCLYVFFVWVYSWNPVPGERFETRSFRTRFSVKERLNLVTVGDFLQAEGFLDAVLDCKDSGDVAELQDFEEDAGVEVTEDEFETFDDYLTGVQQILDFPEDAICDAVTIIGESFTEDGTRELARFAVKFAM
ncbi:uncharacterized protein PAC_17422 [Phialocephala subalpina]|uniref:Uncharacterized protein n=1 Tax=Phialocephala subalpina TaxID=576137 RepID=A0A1L7XR49_9HELO|nr:uncharacterized protein PAC_17422 [Phialocephala subalpina]